MITKSILLVAVLFLVAVPLHADDGKGKKGEAGALEKAKDKVLDSLNWEENVERAKKQIQKTKKNLVEKNKETGLKKSIKNIEKSIEQSSRNAQKVFKKNAKRLEKTLDNLTDGESPSSK
ncbi:ribosomal protein S20 [Nitrospina gracilis]|uniref:hypothetical protein n=1 Tax=Nitrospina sp. Nb-3 TaxID=2940485 RepID=UPI001F15B657|nr:hypothetical protein [Nitrospina sp. Nb-3]MCF8722512.1 ribosomal protein S20 [Nitrospina sp. Nb-3]